MRGSAKNKGKRSDVSPVDSVPASDVAVTRAASSSAAPVCACPNEHIQLWDRETAHRALGTNTFAIVAALIASLCLSALLVFVIPFQTHGGRMSPPTRPCQPGFSSPNASRITVGTFNVRFSPRGFGPPHPVGQGDGTGEQPWPFRMPHIVDRVIWNELDIVGFQEVLYHQLRDLDDALGGVYAFRGVGRDDGGAKGEAVPIFWRRDRFDFVSVRHSWLSKTPDKPGSKDWDAGQTRMVTIVHLRFKTTGDDVFVLNTHWDDRGLESRTKAAELILDLANELNTNEDALVILAGDLNSPPEEQGYQVLTGGRYEPDSPPAAKEAFLDSRHEVQLGRSHTSDELRLSAPYGQYNTFTGFYPGRDKAGIIDVVLQHETSEAWQVDRYGVVPNLIENESGYFLISDHRLVVARFTKSSE